MALFFPTYLCHITNESILGVGFNATNAENNTFRDHFSIWPAELEGDTWCGSSRFERYRGMLVIFSVDVMLKIFCSFDDQIVTSRERLT